MSDIDIKEVNVIIDDKNKEYRDLAIRFRNVCNELEKLEAMRLKVIEYLKNHCLYEEEYDYDYEENIYLSGINDDVEKQELFEILEYKEEEVDTFTEKCQKE